jgi:tetratricopeptide (TPR) repeat protein
VCGCVVVIAVLSSARSLNAQALAPKRQLAGNIPQGCAALVIPASIATGTDDAETRRLISAGQEASLQGEHKAARDAFAQAARRSPNNAILAYYLGREHESLSAGTDAVKEYCRYLQLAPTARDRDEVQGRILRLTPTTQLAQVDEAKANFSSGVALLERRQYTAADSIFGSIATRLPNAPEPYYNRALSRAARGERALATQDFQKYLDLSNNPTDRAAINAAVARLQDRVFGSGQALGSGIALPGLGQMSTGRPFLGLAVMGAVVGATVWGLSEKEGFEIATFQDPFGNPYVDSLPRTTRPNFVIAASAAAVLWGGAAYEAMNYARRSRARAESIIQIGVPTSSRSDHPEPYLAVGTRSVGAGVRLRFH